MFKPKYKISIKLFKLINDIERYYGQLESMRVPSQLLLSISRQNQIQSTYSSNRIEGNILTVAEVTNLLLNERIPTNHDEKEVSNYFNILKKLEEMKDKTITKNLVLDIHKELLSGINDDIKGEFRNTKVVVGRKTKNGKVIVKHMPPFHKSEKISEAIENLCYWVNKAEVHPVIKAGIFHHHFVYIHPFEDGNGRTCRLITALIFLKHNYLINKYFVIDDYYDLDRESYSNKLHTADNADKTEWLEYFSEGVKYSIESAKQKILNGLNTMSFDSRPTKKEIEVLEIINEYREVTSKNISEQLKVTRQQAFNLLNSLAKKGYIERIGERRGSYYKIK